MSKRIQIGIRLPEDLIHELDEARAAMEWPVERTAIIERVIREWLKGQRSTLTPLEQAIERVNRSEAGG